MSKKQKMIEMQDAKTVETVFELYMMSRIASGLAPKTIMTYRQQFHAISKYLKASFSYIAIAHAEAC